MGGGYGKGHVRDVLAACLFFGRERGEAVEGFDVGDYDEDAACDHKQHGDDAERPDDVQAKEDVYTGRLMSTKSGPSILEELTSARRKHFQGSYAKDNDT